MIEESSESDIFCDNTDSDPDFIPGSDLDLDTSKPSFRLSQSLKRLNNIRSTEAQQLKNKEFLVEESSESALSDFEVRSNTDRPSPEDRCSPELVRGRKRKRNPDNWKRERHRKKRLSGKDYETRSGRIVAEKIFSDELCNCARKCNGKIPTDERKNLFQSFYTLSNYNEQNFFLKSCIKSSSVKRRRPTNQSKPSRSHSFSFFLRVKNDDVQVCKTYFRQTFQVSAGRIHNISIKNDVSSVRDKRGKSTPGNKVDTSDVVNHIKSFPAYFSHYTRSHNPNRKYLSPDLTIKKMYDLYVQWCGEYQKNPVKEKMYYHVFSTTFNLHFKPPLKDTCQVCDGLQNRLLVAGEDEKKIIENDKELHLRKAEKARLSLKEDKDRCYDDYYVLTFDLQKALPFPKLSTSVAYYKRNMYVYNLGVHVCNNDQAYMYVWPETEGSRGSQEISACIIKHLTGPANHAKHIVMYSDSCGGQNRNIKVVLSLMKYLQTHNGSTEKIDFKFVVPGHSYLPNDTDFSFIEKRAKTSSNIFSPRDWYDIILGCRKKNKYFLTEMTHEDFLSTQNLEKSVTNRKKNVDGDPLNWLQMRWIRIEKAEPFAMKYKTTFLAEMPFEVINIQKKSENGRPLASLANVKQDLLYPTSRPISMAKKKDMIDLLKYIPPIHHQYFKELKTERGIDQVEPDSDDDCIIYAE